MAVKYYSKARKTLDHYKHMQTFGNIDEECSLIISNLKNYKDNNYNFIVVMVFLLLLLKYLKLIANVFLFLF